MKIQNKLLFGIGLTLVLVSLVVFFATFSPVIKEEVKYAFNKPKEDVLVVAEPLPVEGNYPEGPSEIVAVDREFSIVVPKIGANSKVIKDVDPLNSQEYQMKLTQGVAHAKGTNLPGQEGNVFLFAHSTDTFYNANRYNAVFYLLNKMETGDKFYLVYKENIYEYNIREVNVVDKDAVEYMKAVPGESTATLMTCWPPGTTSKRLVVVGSLVEEN